jgi:glycosyltransferase involved in cell wall biosynthesis
MTRPYRVAHVTTIDLTLRFLLLEQLRGLRREGFEVAGISAPGEWLESLREEGVEPIPWRSATRAWRPIADARAFVELVGILRRGRFDVVHTHNPKPGLMGRVAARIARVPVVVNTVHGFYATPEDPPRRRLPVMGLEWFAARFSNAELYQSGEDLAWARRLRIAPARRQIHLGNGTDLGAFDPAAVPPSRLDELRTELGLPAEGLVIGMVGRLVREKGYGEFFHAARAIRERHPEASFLAVGPSDPDKDDAISAEERAAASADVVFAGYRDDVRDLLALMDVFVLPSWREGLPRSAVEAAAMGRALVLTDIRGCREVGRDGVEALLVPARDAGALTAAIERLVEEPELRARLAASARARAEERFDERRVVDRVVDTYRSLLPARTPPGRPVDVDGLRDVTIRPATHADIPAMAAMHASIMTRAFLPKLGEPFLRVLFRALVEDPDSPTLVAERDGEVIGYTSASVSVPAFRRRFVRRYGVRAALAAAPRLVRPGVVRRAVELLRYPDITRDLPDAECTLIGVRPKTPWGLGGALKSATLTALGDRGVTAAKGFVFQDNLAMRLVAEQAGGRLTSELSLHDGMPSVIYIYPCRPSSPSASVSS